MGVRITIRDFDKDVLDELASRVARERMSMQQYSKAELERLARRPSMTVWLKAVRERKRQSGRKIPARVILDRGGGDRK